MKLVFIEPFGCGDVRAIEQKITSHNQAAKTRPSFFD